MTTYVLTFCTIDAEDIEREFKAISDAEAVEIACHTLSGGEGLYHTITLERADAEGGELMEPAYGWF